mgnify:CR=1 FL=1
MTNPFQIDGYGTESQPPNQPVHSPQFQQQYPVMYAPPQKSASTGWLVGIIAVLLAVVVGIVAYLFGSGAFSSIDEPTTGQAASDDAATSTVVATHTLKSDEEAPAQPSAAPVSHTYTNYAADTDVTSGQFAANVYDAFVAAYRETGATEVAVSAYSPATGKTYTMSCSGDSTVYCSGGNNARVRIW